MTGKEIIEIAKERLLQNANSGESTVQKSEAFIAEQIDAAIDAAIREERERFRPKTLEEAKTFVESEIRRSQTLRCAIESHINEKVLEEREACARLCDNQASYTQMEFNHFPGDDGPDPAVKFDKQSRAVAYRNAAMMIRARSGEQKNGTD